MNKINKIQDILVVIYYYNNKNENFYYLIRDYIIEIVNFLKKNNIDIISKNSYESKIFSNFEKKKFENKKTLLLYLKQENIKNYFEYLNLYRNTSRLFNIDIFCLEYDKNKLIHEIWDQKINDYKETNLYQFTNIEELLSIISHVLYGTPLTIENLKSEGAPKTKNQATQLKADIQTTENYENGTSQDLDIPRFNSPSFFGRKRELNDISDAIINKESKLFYGFHGVGKTRLLKFIDDDKNKPLLFQKNAKNYISIYMDIKDIPKTEHFYDAFWIRIINTIVNKVKYVNTIFNDININYKYEPSYDDFLFIIDKFQNKGYHLLLLMESLDLLFDIACYEVKTLDIIQTQLRHLISNNPVSLICTANKYLHELINVEDQSKSPLYNILHPVELQPIAENELNHLVLFLRPEITLNSYDLKFIEISSGGVPILIRHSFDVLKIRKEKLIENKEENTYSTLFESIEKRCENDGSLEKIWNWMEPYEKVAMIVLSALRIINLNFENNYKIDGLENDKLNLILRILENDLTRIYQSGLILRSNERITVRSKLLEFFVLLKSEKHYAQLTTKNWLKRHAFYNKTDLQLIDDILIIIKNNFNSFKNMLLEYFNDHKNLFNQSNKKKCEIFVSYSHKDELIMQKLIKYLKLLENENITFFTDNDIKSGTAFHDKIFDKLNSTKIFIALISNSFLNSSFIMEKEMKTAHQIYEAGNMQILPIIISPFDINRCKWISSIEYFPKKNYLASLIEDEETKYDIYNKLYLKVKKLIDDFFET